ncbi:MAG TPA: hypothetical protein VNO52_05750 [Methylomirabilota bacterium]|nr:hypothetical protein [Methylomirabilota bacterium]
MQKVIEALIRGIKLKESSLVVTPSGGRHTIGHAVFSKSNAGERDSTACSGHTEVMNYSIAGAIDRRSKTDTDVVDTSLSCHTESVAALIQIRAHRFPPI